MDTIKLPPRLAAIAEKVPQGSRVADVGTDHAWLPLYLLQTKHAVSAVATDIRQGPLDRAIAHAALYELPLRCLLCDGLMQVDRADADTVVIAGMGGENIAEILRAAPWTKENTRLILQPMSRPEVLRRAMPSLGLRILRESLVEDAGRLYSILEAEGGESEALTPAEFYTGKASLLHFDPLWERLLCETTQRFIKSSAGLARSTQEDAAERIKEIQTVLDDLERIRRDICRP